MNCESDEKIFSLAVKGVQALKPYLPGKPLAELEREHGISNAVKLASNENPLGMSSAAREAIIVASKSASLYPDGNAYYLKQALARHLFYKNQSQNQSKNQKLTIDSNQITMGNGSNDVLEIIARSFADQNAAIMYSQHAFAVYPIVTQAIGATHQMVPAFQWGHDLVAMRAAITDQTTVIFIANPNNPTGTFLQSDGLFNFIKSIPENIIIVIDEAYHEYVQQKNYVSAVNWLNDCHNLIVTRTFSKAYGLAGLRIGYCVSHPAVANILNRVRQPFNVNSLSLVAAQAALGDQQFILDSVNINNAGKTQLYHALEKMGLDHILSEGNFIAVDVNKDVDQINEALLKQGIIVRPIGAYQMPTHIRVSIGTETGNTRFLNALKMII